MPTWSPCKRRDFLAKLRRLGLAGPFSGKRHEFMLEYLAAGGTFEDLLAEFPDLEREDLQACLEFAAQSLKLKSRHLVLT